MMHHHDYQNTASPSSVVDEVKHGCLSLLYSKPLPSAPQIASSDFASSSTTTTHSGCITNNSNQRQEMATTGNSSKKKCVRFQLPPQDTESSPSDVREDSLLPPAAATKTQEQEERDDEKPSSGGALWYTRNEMQEFHSTSRRHVHRFFQVSQNQEWIDQFCDDLCLDPQPPSCTTSTRDELHHHQQQQTKRPLTFKQMLIKHPTPMILSSSEDEDEEYIPRGLLLHLYPTIQGNRKRHMKRLLLIQHKLMIQNRNRKKMIDVFGPSSSISTRQSILRLTSIQSSRHSKKIARWLAYHDCMDVMCMVKKELNENK